MVKPVCAVFFFQAEDGIRDADVTGVQTCALPIYAGVVVVQDVLVGLSAQRHAVGPDLAQADAVPPSLAAEDEGFHVSVRTEGAIEGEQVLADAERRADLEAPNVEGAPAAGDLHLD